MDEGELMINGRLSPFIELGVGFNPDLTARDNVIGWLEQQGAGSAAVSSEGRRAPPG